MSPQATLVLTRSDVEALLGWDECIAAVEAAFIAHAEGRTLAPAVLAVPAQHGVFHVKAAGLRTGRTWFAAKTNANFPGNPARTGLPAIQGVIVLCDGNDGFPLAVLDSGELTARRTAAATAVAARRLAPPDATTATICGGGTQGRAQLRALARVLPLRRVHVWDADAARAAAYARELSAELGLDVAVATDLAPAVRESQVCVTCTPARAPFLGPEHVAPGTFVAAVGADSPEKQELDPRLLAAATVVVDLLESCARSGELHHALAAGLMTERDVHAELGEVLACRRPGRRTPREVVVFDSTGTALQDVAAAALVYERAAAMGRGQIVNLSR